VKVKFDFSLIVVSIGLEGRDNYNPWPPQWPNGKISDVVYMPTPDAPESVLLLLLKYSILLIYISCFE
jgi:hypothetical protein